MERKAVFRVIMALLLTSTLALPFNIQRVKAEPGTIYIRADGSVDPRTAPISTLDNVTYTFADNIYQGIVVERSNIIIDGAGYTLQGTRANNSRGMSSSGVRVLSNVTIKNINIKDFDFGVYLKYVKNCTFSGNTITNTYGIAGAGVYFEGVSNSTFSGNTMTNNTNFGVYLAGSSNIFSGNTVTNGSRYGVYLPMSSKNIFSGNTITNNFDTGVSIVGGIYGVGFMNNTFHGNTITNNGKGVSLGLLAGDTFSGNNITNNSQYGILLSSSLNNSIIGNNITNNGGGIAFNSGSANNVFRGNSMTNNSRNFVFDRVDSLVNDVDPSNTVDGKPVYYWVNKRDATVPTDAGDVVLANCTSITVQNLNLAANGAGIYLVGTTHSLIGKNNLLNGVGIWLDYISTPDYYRGSNNNSIVANSVTNSHIYIDSSSNNAIYHNNFVNSVAHVSLGSANVWDDGYPSGGNFWSSYTGTDSNGDGIGDTPYLIGDANNQDRYPLVAPVVWDYATPIPVVLGGTVNWVSLSSNSTISAFKFNQAQRQISYRATGTDGTIGFCQITIPNALLSGPYNVLVNNSSPLILKETSNGTHTSLYFTYSHSTKTVEIRGTSVGVAPQLPLVPILQLLAILIILTAVAAVLVKKKFLRRSKTDKVG